MSLASTPQAQATATAALTTAPTDANFNSVSLLLRGNATAGSTTVTDSGPLSMSGGAAVGNAAVSATQVKWGSGSWGFDGTGDYLTLPTNTAFAFGTGLFTIECWVWLGTGNTVLDDGKWLTSGASGADPYFRIYNGKLQFGTIGFGNTADGVAAVPTGQWVHVAICRSTSTSIRLFLNGVLDVSATIGSGTSYTSSGVMSIGGRSGSATGTLNGYIDDLRITKGVARYTAAFTPPTDEFPGGTSGTVTAPGVLGSPQLFGMALVDGSVLVPGVLGSPALLGIAPVGGRISVPGVLGAALVLGEHDFTTRIAADRPDRYFLRLTGAGDDIEDIPISSWQATLRAFEPSYAQAVVPSAENWIDQIVAGTYFEVIRQAFSPEGDVIEQPMAAAPMGIPSLAQGPNNYSATITGYGVASSGLESIERELTEERVIFTYPVGVRVRCAIDWLLRPGHTARSGDTTFVVRYISYYVQASDSGKVDAFMDVGE